MRDPVWVYDVWSTYTDGYYREYQQLPDDTRLTADLAMRQLAEIARLKKAGVRFDYYMMNAFWFAPDGAYRQWRRPDWPKGPDPWIDACQKNGLKPGLWLGCNSLWKIDVAPEWQDSLAVKDPAEGALEALSFYEGGFFPHFMQTLQHWYDRGFRMFEFDAANFDAATPAARRNQSPQEIRERNEQAFSSALKEFRRKNPDVMLVAFNGFGGDIFTTATPFPFKLPVDLRWLGVFDTLYSGDIRVSDVPQMSFWRSVDLFNDHMVRRYEQSAIPLERIDPFCTFTNTWFGHKRGKSAWKGMLLRTVARGSWKKTVYGSLELLDEDDARWFAKVQDIFGPLVALGRTKTFGGIPGEVQPYGFSSFDAQGSIYTIVNPTQEIRDVDMPLLSRLQNAAPPGRVLFRDAGFNPRLAGMTIRLGPGQMCLVGFGRYADAQYDLGVESDTIIPHRIEPVQASFSTAGSHVIQAEVKPPSKGDLRIVFWQRAEDGTAPRSRTMKIEAMQKGQRLTVMQPDQDKAVSTGISWGAGEIRNADMDPAAVIAIRCSSAEKQPIHLEGRVYAVEYDLT